MKDTVINLREKLSKFSEHWSPRVVAEMNDYQFKLAKLPGEFVWHSHADKETLEFRNKTVRLAAEEMFVVPKGIEHRPVTPLECCVMLVEPRGVVNTVDISGAYTARNDIWV